MYFSNIANLELRQYHNVVKASFNISLEDMLISDLFKVEEIDNGWFRIYPLFYADQIICNSSDVVILENKVIICKSADYVHFSFEGGDTVDDFVVEYKKMVYHNHNAFTFHIIDSNGYPLSNVECLFYLNGRMMTASTDVNGIIHIPCGIIEHLKLTFKYENIVKELTV